MMIIKYVLLLIEYVVYNLDIGYGNYILTSPAAERKGRAKQYNNDTTFIGKSYAERKNHNSNKAEHVNLLLQEKTNNSELIKSRLSQKHILSDSHQHLNDGPNIVIHHAHDNDQGGKESNENNIKGKDAGKINAPELMSDINTLTNPYNVKIKIDL